MLEETNIYTLGGTVQAGGGRYLERQADTDLLSLCRAGKFAYILAARQMGKSSLMMRTAEQLSEEGIRTVKLDLTLIGTQVEAENWYFGLLFEIKKQLRLKFDLLEWWQSYTNLGHTQRLTLFFEEVLLPRLESKLVIFIDEIDTTLSLSFTDDFFAAVRALYTGRARNPELVRLSFVLIGVATPGDLIRDPKRTPFNIGVRVEMTDFSLAEAFPLTAGLNLPSQEAAKVLGYALEWTGGHPYLTQRLCRALTERDWQIWAKEDVAQVVEATFFNEQSEQDNNLQFVRDMLTKRAPDLAGVLSIYREVRRVRRKVIDEEQSLIKSHLKLSGVVKREQHFLKVRNLIYRNVFDEKWIKTHLPINWARRFRQASRLIAILLVISILMTGLAIYALIQQNEAELQRNEARTAQQTAQNAQTTSEARRLEAEQQRNLSLSRELAANALGKATDDPELGLLLALQAERTTHTAQSEAALRQLMLASPLITTLRGANTEWLSATLNPEASRLVTTGTDGTVQLWDFNTRKPLTTLNGHTGPVYGAVFSPDGKLLATAGADATLRLWEPITGQMQKVLQATSVIYAITFSPDGKKLISGSRDGTVLIWEVTTGQLLLTLKGHGSLVSGVAYSPDGKRIVTASYDGTARIWDAQTGQPLFALAGHTDRLNSAAFSPDGKKVITASRDHTTRLWNSTDGTSLTILKGHSEEVTSAVFSPDGSKIVTASVDKTLRTWDDEGKPLEVFTGHTDRVNFAGFASDSIRIVSVSADKTIRIWQITNRAGVTILAEHSDVVQNAAFSPDSHLVVTAGNIQAPKLWNVSTGKLLTTFSKVCICLDLNVAFSPDGKFVVTSDANGSISIRETSSDQSLFSQSLHSDVIFTAYYSPDGTKIITASKDKTARIWEAKTLKPIAVLPHNSSVLSAAYSPDGSKIVTATDAGTLQIWDAATQQLIQNIQAHSASIKTAFFNPDSSKIITASEDKTARIWDAATGKLVLTLTGHTDIVNMAQFSPDGKLIITASSDGTARIWEVASGKLEIILTGHQGRLGSASFSPDGRTVVTTATDKTARLYRWEVFAPVTDLVTEAQQRLGRSLNCDEQKVYLHLTSC